MEQVVVEKWIDNPLSEKGMQYIAGLPLNLCVIVRAKNVNSSDPNYPKIQVEFAEKIKTNDRLPSLRQRLNANDPRFSSGAQRAWETLDLELAKSFLGVEIPKGEAVVEILKPAPKDDFGQEAHIQYTEILESQFSESQKQYPDNHLKRAGKDGNYFYAANGEKVGSRKEVVFTAPGTLPKVTLIPGQFAETSETAMSIMANAPAISSDLASASN